MPSFTFSSAVAANTQYLPLTGWQYEYLPFASAVKLLIQSTVADTTLQITSGSETIMEFSPVAQAPAGGSANVPSELYISPHVWRAPAGDRLKLNVQVKTTGTVSGIVYVNPLR